MRRVFGCRPCADGRGKLLATNRRMARRFVPIMAVMALAVAACYAFEEGREPSWTVQYAATDVKQRATTLLSRTGYQVLHADDRLIEAEKQRDVGSFD